MFTLRHKFTFGFSSWVFLQYFRHFPRVLDMGNKSCSLHARYILYCIDYRLQDCTPKLPLMTKCITCIIHQHLIPKGKRKLR